MHDTIATDYTVYAAHLQDTTTQQNALPQMLAIHSAPDSRLHYDTNKQAVVFSNYDKRKATETELPFAGNP